MWRMIMGVIALVVATATPARAKWRRAESPNFVLTGDLPENALRERILLLEDFDRLLRILTPGEEQPAPAKLHVYLVSGHAALNVVRDLQAGLDGFYTASTDGIVAAVDVGGADEGNEILFHEYAHHFMMQNSTVIYPAWFVEGFAEYFETVRFGNRRIDIGNISRGWLYRLQHGTWLPMERVLSAGPQGLNEDGLDAYYAESWLLVHYFYSNPQRQAALNRLLAAQRRQPPAEAVNAAMGMPPEGLARELRNYIAAGSLAYRQMVKPEVAPPPVTVTTLPASASALILYEAALRAGLPAARGPAYLQQIRTAAARYPDDPLAMRVLADIELRFGDGAVADRLLDRLLVASPNDAELLYLKGLRWLIAAQGTNPPPQAAATARQWFGRAQRADQNRFQTFYRYAQSLRGQPEYLSDNTSNALLLAHQLAPQVHGITMEAASVLIARHEYREAIALLTPLSSDPHNMSLAQAARDMIARAEAAAAAATPPARTPAAAPTSAGN
jgi:hypothetical protein